MIERGSLGAVGREEEVVFLFIALNLKVSEAEVAGGASELLDQGDLTRVVLGIEGEAGVRSGGFLSLLDDVLTEGMGKAVEVAFSEGWLVGGAILADEMVAATRSFGNGAGVEVEAEGVILPISLAGDHVLAEEPELAGELVEAEVSFGEFHLETLVDVFIEVIEKLLLGVGEAAIDAFLEFLLELIEGGFNLVRGAAGLVNLENPFFKIDATFDGAEDLI